MMLNQKNIDLQSKKRTIVTNFNLLSSIEACSKLLEDPQWKYFEIAVRATLYTLGNDFLALHYGHEKQPLYQLVLNPENLEKNIREMFSVETFEKETLAESIALTFGKHEIQNIEVRMKIIELEASMSGWIKFITKTENSTKMIKALTESYLKHYRDSWIDEEKKLTPLLQEDLNASINRMTEKLKKKLKEKGLDFSGEK